MKEGRKETKSRGKEEGKEGRKKGKKKMAENILKCLVLTVCKVFLRQDLFCLLISLSETL